MSKTIVDVLEMPGLLAQAIQHGNCHVGGYRLTSYPRRSLMGKILGSAIVVLSVMFVFAISWADMGKSAMPLKATTGSKAEQHVTEGIVHYDKGHWDVAKKHFSEAAKADPQ